jgi:hypothetical protein
MAGSTSRALAIARATSKGDSGSKSVLLRTMISAARNICGYFSGLSLELPGDGEAYSQRLDWILHAVHYTGLAYCCRHRRRSSRREAHREQRIRLDQRTVGIGDLIGFAVQQIEAIQLHAPAVFRTYNQTARSIGRSQETRRRRPPSAGAVRNRDSAGREPAGLLAEPDTRGSDHVGCAGS